MTHRVVCAALIQGDRVLPGHRSPGRRWHPGVRDLPGGHVDAGGSQAAALARELRQELGIRIGMPAGPPDAVLTAPEHDEVRWAGAAELAGLPLAHPGHRDLLACRLGSG